MDFELYFKPCVNSFDRFTPADTPHRNRDKITNEYDSSNVWFHFIRKKQMLDTDGYTHPFSITISIINWNNILTRIIL